MNCCCICTENYFNGKNVASLYCGHVFHTDCIGQWIRSSNQRVCPHCRVNINGYVPKLYLDSSESHNDSSLISKQEELVLENSRLKHDLEEERDKTRALREQFEYRIRVLEKGANENAQRHQDVEREKNLIEKENKLLNTTVKNLRVAIQNHINDRTHLKQDIQYLNKMLVTLEESNSRLRFRNAELKSKINGKHQNKVY
jgi:chromosome segregation ATPase